MTILPAKNYRSLLTEKGIYSLTKNLFKKAVKGVVEKKERYLIQFEFPHFPLMIPDGYHIEIREVRPDEAARIPEEILIPEHILKERWGHGAKMYGAFWEGKIVYYAWIFIGDLFHDKTDGFYLRLNQSEAYCFDYKGATDLCPKAFRSFKLISALIWVMLKNEEKRLRGKPLFYALATPDNKVSLNFHLNILRGEVVATMCHYRLFGCKWSIRKSIKNSPVPLSG